MKTFFALVLVATLAIGCGGAGGGVKRAPMSAPTVLVQHTQGGLEVRLVEDWTPAEKSQYTSDGNILAGGAYRQADLMADDFRARGVLLPVKAIIIDFRHAGSAAAYIGYDLVVAHFTEPSGLPGLAGAFATLALENGASLEQVSEAAAAANHDALSVGLDP